MKKKIISTLLVISLIVTLLASCSKGTVETGNVADGEKHLNVALMWLSTDLDPANDYNGWSLSRMGIAETLTVLNKNVEVEACLADSWEKIDELTWKFHIRDGVTFQNGNPLNAEAVKNCIQRSFDKNKRATEYFKLDKMVADDQELTIITKEPCGALLNNLVEPIFSIIDVSVDETTIPMSPVGTGPYVVTEYVSEVSAQCIKNEKYWDGKPGLDSVSFTYIKDDDSRVLALQSGEIDLAMKISNSSIPLFSDKSKYTISKVTGLRGGTIAMNLQRPFLSQVQARKAISYAIDKDKYAKLIGEGPATGLFSKALPFGNDKLEGYKVDVDKANQILQDEGYIDSNGDGIREMNGEKIHLQFYLDTSGGVAATLAQALQSDLSKIGIEVELIQSENLSEIKKSGTFDMYYNGSNAAPTGDPQAYLMLTYMTKGISNFSYYSSPEIDSLITKLGSTFDLEGRQKLAQEASQILLDDAVNLFITYTPSNLVGSSKVKNFAAHPADYYVMTKDITIE